MNFLQQSWWLFSNHSAYLFKAAGVTLLIAITGTVTGSIFGLLIGVVRTIPVSPKDGPVKYALLKVANAILGIYIEVFRGTPMIVQAMVIFYGFAYGGVYLNRIFAGFFIVAINTGAYMAEIVRGGIISIDKGQFEAAHSVGMTHWQTMINVVLPQVIRNILPATGNEFVINIKDTSVLSVISVTELFFQSKSLAGTYYLYFQMFLITCIFYLIMTFTVTRLLRLLERKLEGSGTYTIHGSHTLNETEIKVRENAYGQR
ncbi:MAG: amino acid ABC transporter permease [Syntrophomonadaceae bacterium]|nr:amino acid ABC transporter permease [Syntrophomonadaceae bacterium]